LANSPEFASRPAARSARADAGITPPFAAMAMKFKRPPTATIQTNLRSRLRRMHPAASP
jgi:hypothetical protein